VVGRTARILTATAPESIERFTVINLDEGVETYRITVQRRDFEKLASGEISPEEILLNAEIAEPKPGDPEASFTALDHYPRFSYDMGPAVRQQIGGPDGFYFGQLLWRLNGGVAIDDQAAREQRRAVGTGLELAPDITKRFSAAVRMSKAN